MILEKLDKYIKSSGLKKQKVAENLDISPQHLSGVINKRYPLSVDLEQKIINLIK